MFFVKVSWILLFYTSDGVMCNIDDFACIHWSNQTFSYVVQYLCFLFLAIFASYTKSVESKLGDHSPLVVNTVDVSGRLCYGSDSSMINCLMLELSAHCTLQKTWDLNGLPLLWMFVADGIIWHLVSTASCCAFTKVVLQHQKVYINGKRSLINHITLWHFVRVLVRFRMESYMW